MRILKVRFKNLNSLSGEWEIDLTHSAFTSSGIFAITGPTGAGKTTILDAICLALYGRTPRLGKITKSGNEIMSRQTYECFAEITFETQAGRFRCNWRQHRARKNSNGELQSPKHDIADADSDKILEEKKSGVAEKIETVTGMDFDRFTRSMLLAQGGFAAFLQASVDDRSPILEQITGTEIYSQISIKVHEQRAEERKKLDILKADLAGINLISKENEVQLKETLNQKIYEETNLSLQVTQTNQAIAWLGGISHLENELQHLKENKQDWQIRWDKFQPEFEKLNRAKKALELTGEYKVLCSLRHEQEKDKQNQIKYQESFLEEKHSFNYAQESVRSAFENLEKIKKEQIEILPIIRKVREIDIQLGAKDESIKKSLHLIEDLEKSLRTLQLKSSQDSKMLLQKEKVLQEVLDNISDTKSDERLVEHLTGILTQFDRLIDINKSHSAKLKEVKENERKMLKTTQFLTEQTFNFKVHKEEVQSIQSEFNKKQIQLKHLLDISLKQLAIHHQALITQKSELSKEFEVQSQNIENWEKEEIELQNKFSMLRRIQDFEKSRCQLKDGEPCPLCGAKEHPFVKSNIPLPDETEILQVKSHLKMATKSVSNLKVKIAETQKDIEQTAIKTQNYNEKFTLLQEDINKEVLYINKEVLLPSSKKQIDDDGVEADVKLDEGVKLDKGVKLDNTLNLAEKTEKEVVSLQKMLEKKKDALANFDSANQAATYKKELAEQNFERAKKDVKEFADHLQNAKDEVLQQLSPFGFKFISINDLGASNALGASNGLGAFNGLDTVDNLDQIKIELKSRRDNWISQQKKLTELEKDIAKLKLKIEHQTEQIIKFDSEIEKEKNLMQSLQRDRDILSTERYERFSNKSTDIEESRISSEIETAQNNLDSARKSFNGVSEQLVRLETKIEEIKKSVIARADQLKMTQELFDVQLISSGFIDESLYLVACIPDTERENLIVQTEKFKKEQAEFEIKERDKRALLEFEQQKQVTDKSTEQLTEQVNNFSKICKELQNEIFDIQKQLKDNDNLKQRQKEKLKVIETQESEWLRWDNLHELIGSADGKKYRNFAQGITFEMMIGHANQQLQKMTDRYLLTRVEKQPLELNVIDNYQAGETRSTKNLSGGESFIVSLSLALGLSQMASKNVKVDSLFLDEGFGTLDQEALDTALETLAGLKQDGKLIGVISHVPALKERISTQIEVLPQTGGISIIKGDGCGKFNLKSSLTT